MKGYDDEDVIIANLKGDDAFNKLLAATLEKPRPERGVEEQEPK